MPNLVEFVVAARGRFPLRRRFEALAPRERLLVGICAGMLALVLGYALVDSLLEFRQRAVLRYLSEQRDLQWMQQNQHRVVTGEGVTGGGELLSTIVNTTAGEFGFRPRRTQTETDGVSARIEAEKFANVLRWAHALESRHGVEITNADIDAGEPGTVDARFSMR